MEAKWFCTLCFSSNFLFNIMFICHFITVNTLDMVESGYSRTWRVSIILQIRWIPGIICTIVPTGLYSSGVKTGQLVHTSLSQDAWGLAKIEGKFYDNNHTRVQWQRQNSCAKCGEDGKLALCMHTMCRRSTHTHLKDCNDQTHKHWIHLKPRNATHLRWNCSTTTATNNFQFTFIQPMRLLVTSVMIIIAGASRGWVSSTPTF